MTGPYIHQSYPTGAVGQLWQPYTSSTPYKQPYLIINSAPDVGPYSDGWNKRRIVLFLGIVGRRDKNKGMNPIKHVR